MSLEIFVRKDIGNGKAVAICGTGQHQYPSYVLKLEVATAEGKTEVKLFPPGPLGNLSAKEAICLYRSIRSEDDFSRQYTA